MKITIRSLSFLLPVLLLGCTFTQLNEVYKVAKGLSEERNHPKAEKAAVVSNETPVENTGVESGD